MGGIGFTFLFIGKGMLEFVGLQTADLTRGDLAATSALFDAAAAAACRADLGSGMGLAKSPVPVGVLGLGVRTGDLSC